MAISVEVPFIKGRDGRLYLTHAQLCCDTELMAFYERYKHCFKDGPGDTVIYDPEYANAPRHPHA